MSLWHCPEHGLVGPMACCQKASLASFNPILPAIGGPGQCGVNGVVLTPAKPDETEGKQP